MTTFQRVGISRSVVEFSATVLVALIVYTVYSIAPLPSTGLLIVGVIVIPILLKKPEYAPILVAILLPFRDVHIVSIVHLKRLVIWSMLIYVIFRQPYFFQQRRNTSLRQFGKMAFILLVSIVISLIIAAKAIGTMTDITPEMFRSIVADAITILDLLAMTYLVYYSARMSHAIRRLLDVSLAISAFIGFLGIAQYYLGKPPRLFEVFFDSEFVFWGRATSVFLNPNSFGTYLSAMIVLAVCSCFLEMRSTWKRFGFYLPIACITLFAQFLSFSRGALIQTSLGGIIGFIAYNLQFSKKRISWKLTMFICSIAIIVIFSPQIYDMFMRFRLGSLRETDYQKALYLTRTTSDSLRKYTIIQSLKTFKEHPVLGIGFDMFAAKRMASGLSPHNQFLKILTEMGLIGFIPFILLLSSVITTAWRYLSFSSESDKEGDFRQIAFLLFMVICATIPGFFFTDMLLTMSVTGYWWLFAGAVFILFESNVYTINS